MRMVGSSFDFSMSSVPCLGVCISVWDLCADLSAPGYHLFLARSLSAALLLSSGHARRLPVQAAHGWREQCSHSGQDTCDPRKANNYIGRKILEKESAYHSSQWSRSSGQG